jgi:hypothetical protein
MTISSLSWHQLQFAVLVIRVLSPRQRCQKVYFHTEKHKFVYFRRPWNGKSFIYFKGIRHFMVIWYSFDNLVLFVLIWIDVSFWYVVPRKNLSTLVPVL